ncbi:bifunctional glycosyltransferase family 2/GtrA family protein [Demequina lutea]|uniref:dolichyl-phosphate beta-glucosyltransferase n=3 Tax=Demequina lutea TaxID=431489 RepID=A0A7Y9ZB02_9MICO|nr:bifunctional glycosyltransferase family 2/GtrA family protein [Demequina lutea]NYI42069.1 putative flippase GtrA [Demequina lutea]
MSTASSASAHTPAPAREPRTERLGVTAAAGPVLDLVIPVFNEVAGLEASVRAVCAYLRDALPFSWRVTIADNASTDGTYALAERLAAELPQVRVVRLEAKGRGRALSTVWSTSDAQVLAYCDVDLSTNLSALLPLVAPLVSGHSHVAIGTRLSRSSRVVRGPKREFISRSYNLLLRTSLAARFSDAQCGFKAIRADVARELLPLVQDTGWFFDTELLVLAERAGLRIHEVPVDWVDDPDSRVDIVATAMADLKGVVRVGRELMSGALPLREIGQHLPLVGDSQTRIVQGVVVPPDAPPQTALLHQLVRFAVVGIASTLAFALLFLLLRGPMGAQAANFSALLLTAIANTAANRRVTFGFRGSTNAARHQGQGLLVFFFGWALTSGSLALLTATAPTAPHSVELAVLVIANLAATVLRFVLLRRWVFRPRPAATTEGARTAVDLTDAPADKNIPEGALR